MSTLNTTTSDDSLALVNSLYGPGATACWYLTCFACFVSWTLHPKKKGSDSITVDFIAVITFPTVAAAHLVAQVQSYPWPELHDDQFAKQLHASMSASLTIIETYLIVCVVLLIPTVFIRSIKRMVPLALTGIFCVAAETFLFFAIPTIRDSTRIFNRSFIVNHIPLLAIVLGLVPVLTALLCYFIYLTFVPLRPPPRAVPPLGASPELVRHYRRANAQRDPEQAKAVRRLAILSVPFTIISIPGLILSAGVSGASVVDDLLRSGWEGVVKLANIPSYLIDEFFPQTSTTIMDLDQAVALLTGMTVLGFCLYSTAEARYRRWWKAERERIDAAARRMVENTSTGYEQAFDALAGFDPEDMELHEPRQNERRG